MKNIFTKYEHFTVKNTIKNNGWAVGYKNIKQILSLFLENSTKLSNGYLPQEMKNCQSFTQMHKIFLTDFTDSLPCTANFTGVKSKFPGRPHSDPSI